MSDCAGDVCGTERPELVSSGVGLLSCTLGQIWGGGVSYRMGISGSLRKFLCTRLSLLGSWCIMMDHDGSWFMIPLLNWPLDATWIFLNHTESPTCLSREKTPGGDSPIMEYHGSPLFLRVKNAFVLLIHTGRSGRGSMLRGLLLQGSYAGARTFQWDRGGQGGQTKQGKLWMLAQLVIGDVPAAKI